MKRDRHGMSYSPEYSNWGNMMQRCYNPKAPNYQSYGGRGVTVAKVWHTFAGFFRDMGCRPFPKATVERIDNNKGYGPGNCRWATHKDQQQNKRTSRLLTVDGKTLTAVQWAELKGVKKGLIFTRLRRGHDAYTAVNAPIIHNAVGIKQWKENKL